MTTPSTLPWRVAGVSISIALAWVCHLEWKNRQSDSPLAIAAVSPRPVPHKIGFLKPATAITRGETPTTHSASAIEFTSGDLRCYWFGGTREGHRDVSIWTSHWNSKTKVWDSPVVCLERRWLEEETGINIRKLGNPVVYSRGNQVELFVVGVSMGGWSGSAIYHLTSTDKGLTFQNPRRLITSPFLNISTLARGAALPAEDGNSILLPSYHEFIVKYPYWIQLNNKRNISYLYSHQQARGFLQPSQVYAENMSHTFLRDTHDEGAIHLISSTQSDLRQSSLTRLPIPNPNSGLAAIALNEGILLACNDTLEKRDQLSLLFQNNDSLHQPWKLIHHVETANREPDELEIKKLRYSYPWLMQTQDGSLHLFYTWNRREIRHLHFDGKDWLTPNNLDAK